MIVDVLENQQIGIRIALASLELPSLPHIHTRTFQIYFIWIKIGIILTNYFKNCSFLILNWKLSISFFL